MGVGRTRLLSVVYHSAAVPGFSAADLEDLLAAARTKNRASRVTGMLLAENGRFLQSLEGPEATVRALMRTIQADPRHEHVRILAEESIASRRFPDWAMAHGHVGELEAMPLAAYTEALVTARTELPEPPTLLERAGRLLRRGPEA